MTEVQCKNILELYDKDIRVGTVIELNKKYYVIVGFKTDTNLKDNLSLVTLEFNHIPTQEEVLERLDIKKRQYYTYVKLYKIKNARVLGYIEIETVWNSRFIAEWKSFYNNYIEYAILQDKLQVCTLIYNKMENRYEVLLKLSPYRSIILEKEMSEEELIKYIELQGKSIKINNMNGNFETFCRINGITYIKNYSTIRLMKIANKLSLLGLM